MTEPAGYPKALERTVTLAGGGRVRIRPIRPDDEPRLSLLYDRLSRHTAYQRFFTVMKRLPPDWAHYFANVDYRRRLALVAEPDAEGEPELIGVGRLEPAEEPDTEELALVIQDGWQGRGLGLVLLRSVLDAAHALGIRRFRAHILADNHRMLGLLTRYTEVLERSLASGIVSLAFRWPGRPRAR